MFSKIKKILEAIPEIFSLRMSSKWLKLPAPPLIIIGNRVNELIF